MSREIMEKVIGKTIAKVEVYDRRMEIFFEDGTSIDISALAVGDCDYVDLDVSGPYAPSDR